MVCSFPSQILVLRDNELIAIPPEVGSLHRLKELHIQGNRLTVLPPELGQYSWCDFYYALYIKYDVFVFKSVIVLRFRKMWDKAIVDFNLIYHPMDRIAILFTGESPFAELFYCKP